MQITLYSNFSKRINSTKQPSSGTAKTVTLKGPCSLERPSFVLTGNMPSYNYLKWGNRYYFITNTTLLDNDRYAIECNHDLLATYKSNITNTTAFVEYAQNDFNSNILDTRFSQTSSVSKLSYTADLSSVFISGGMYILSVAGQDAVAQKYALTFSQLQTLGNWLSNLDEDGTIVQKLTALYGNVYNCILGCTWVPYTCASSSVSGQLYLGSFAVPGLNSVMVMRSEVAISYTLIDGISIPWISEFPRQVKENINLFLPGVGNVPLNTSQLNGVGSLGVDLLADTTGQIVYTISWTTSSGKKDRLYFSGNAGCQIPVTQMTQSIVGMGLSWLLDNPYTEGAFNNIGTTASSVGGQGSAALGYMCIRYSSIIITNYAFGWSAAQSSIASTLGRPLMAVRQLNLTGYVKCNGASVDCDATDEEKGIINSYLNSGIFIE